MPDTPPGPLISPDTPYPRITVEALERAKARTKIATIDGLAQALGINRQSFWRARRGLYDIRLTEAMRISKAAGWTIERCFEGGPDA